MTQFHWLDGLRIIDLTTAWAGPAVGRFLGVLGADVVKVESARRYDIWRGNANRAIGTAENGRLYNQAPNFLGLNRNKRGISLELTVPEGRQVFLRMVERADALVSNFSARVLPNLGLDYATLQTVNPSLIVLNMPSLGASGPYRDLAGYGSIIEGLGGLASRFGYLHEGARVSQTFFPDGVAGIHASLALLAALQRRAASGEGAYIDLSQQETMWLQLGEGLVQSSLTSRSPARLGNASPRCVPSGIYRTNDSRWVAIVVKNDAQFAGLVQVASPHLIAFEACNGDRRLGERAAIDNAVDEWLATMTSNEVVTQLGRAGVRAAIVNDYGTGADAPELHALDAFERVEHAEVGPQSYLRIPVRFDGEAISTRRPGVRFSEHTDEVLKEWLGMTEEELARLRKVGAVSDEIALDN